jgi:hypothetical protein
MVHVQNTGDHEFREENAVVDNAVDHDAAEKAFEQYEARDTIPYLTKPASRWYILSPQGPCWICAKK